MSEPVVLHDQTGAVLTITLNRPDKLNAFNDEMTALTIAALERAASDSSVRVIVLRGSGRGYSSGQDLEAFIKLKSSPGPFSVADHLRHGYNTLVTRIREIEKPVIASLNGIAAGVGLSIALCCDLRIAGDDAMLTLGFSKIGLVSDGGGSMMLPLLAGFSRGLELAWTSDRIDAHEALRFGLVNRVVPAAELAGETLAYAQKFAELSPTALALTKRTFNAIVLPNFAAALEAEALAQEEAAAGPDLIEGVQAFMQKRKPAYAAR
jgi:2-(1,2-epoxy-1,2-dihydrophenyl)acetyl-CoA isomerase